MRERNLRHKPTEVTNSRNTEDLRLSRFVVHSITMGCPQRVLVVWKRLRKVAGDFGQRDLGIFEANSPHWHPRATVRTSGRAVAQ
jgi:hypothetical protein